MPDHSPKTHFGFKSVPEDQKPRLVRGVFSSVAGRYDAMNDAMSLGIHRTWKAAMVDWLAPRSGQSVLDVAGGTGDIGFRILDRAPEADVTLLDFSEEMLGEGRKRAKARGREGQISWVVGDAMDLPFADGSFDSYTISFGIRNVTDMEKGLKEAFRVLRIGGRLVVLEFSRMTVPLLQWAYDRYSFSAIPQMGGLIANDRDSYQYLVESIRKFPEQEEFARMIEGAGFENVRFRNLSFGIAALHSGWKI